MIDVTVTGATEVCAKLDRASMAVGRGPDLERALVAGCLPPLNAAKSACPYRTGNLRRSIHIGGHSAGSGGLPEGASDIGGNVTGAYVASVLVGTNLEYAAAVEYGRGPLRIVPKNGKALFWPGASHPVPYVDQKARAPQPYMRPAFDGAGPEIAAEMARAIALMLAAAL